MIVRICDKCGADITYLSHMCLKATKINREEPKEMGKYDFCEKCFQKFILSLYSKDKEE